MSSVIDHDKTCTMNYNKLDQEAIDNVPEISNASTIVDAVDVADDIKLPNIVDNLSQELCQFTHVTNVAKSTTKTFNGYD